MRVLLVVFSAILLAFLVYLFLDYIKFNPLITGWLCCTTCIGFITYFKEHL